ncbi:MAG: hypothetical protein K1Y36_17670 [Blastocatellia bacterium]|nr:hypothetical protein [Blastocatellia bacterium]
MFSQPAIFAALTMLMTWGGLPSSGQERPAVLPLVAQGSALVLPEPPPVIPVGFPPVAINGSRSIFSSLRYVETDPQIVEKVIRFLGDPSFQVINSQRQTISDDNRLKMKAMAALRTKKGTIKLKQPFEYDECGFSRLSFFLIVEQGVATVYLDAPCQGAHKITVSRFTKAELGYFDLSGQFHQVRKGNTTKQRLALRFPGYPNNL